MKYIVETLERGVWETYSEADTMEEATQLASAILLPEDRIRISTPDGQIL